jgi:hypothetical protein
MSGMINTIPGGNVYPWLNSGSSTSLGDRASAMSGFPGSPAKEDQAEAPGTAMPNTVGGASNMLVAGVTFVGLLVVLMFAGHALDGEENFKNIKVSFYNVILISLAAVVGIPLMKFLFAKVPISALRNWVAAV